MSVYQNVWHVKQQQQQHWLSWLQCNWPQPASYSCKIQDDGQFRKKEKTYDIWRVIGTRQNLQLYCCFVFTRHKFRGVIIFSFCRDWICCERRNGVLFFNEAANNTEKVFQLHFIVDRGMNEQRLKDISHLFIHILFIRTYPEIFPRVLVVMYFYIRIFQEEEGNFLPLMTLHNQELGLQKWQCSFFS